MQSQASLISIVLTTPLINEYFGVGVTSEAKDDEAPELNPGWVHRRTNPNSEVRHTSHALLKFDGQKQSRSTANIASALKA